MAKTYLRRVGSKIVHEFAVTEDDGPTYTPISLTGGGTVLTAGLLRLSDGLQIPVASVSALSAPDDNVAQIIIDEGVTVEDGDFQLQFEAQVSGRPEPIFGAVIYRLIASAW